MPFSGALPCVKLHSWPWPQNSGTICLWGVCFCANGYPGCVSMAWAWQPTVWHWGRRDRWQPNAIYCLPLPLVSPDHINHDPTGRGYMTRLSFKSLQLMSFKLLRMSFSLAWLHFPYICPCLCGLTHCAESCRSHLPFRAFHQLLILECHMHLYTHANIFAICFTYRQNVHLRPHSDICSFPHTVRGL